MTTHTTPPCKFTDAYIARNDDDVQALRKVIRTLKSNGHPVVAVDDGRREPCTTERDILYHVVGVDGAVGLVTESGAYAYVIAGQGGMEDTLYDYSVSLSDILDPLFD